MAISDGIETQPGSLVAIWNALDVVSFDSDPVAVDRHIRQRKDGR
jgi:hypothetical protein